MTLIQIWLEVNNITNCPQSIYIFNVNIFLYQPQKKLYNINQYLNMQMQIAPFNMIYAGIPRCFVKMTACLASVSNVLYKFDQYYLSAMIFHVLECYSFLD